MKQVLIVVALFVTGLGVGCASLSEYITPADIDSGSVAYVVGAGVADANTFTGYANLAKAIKLEAAVDSAYAVKSLAIQQLADKNQLDYSLCKDATTTNTKIAQQREESLFGATGLLSTGLVSLGFGSLTGLLGLMRKRPGDVTAEEMETAVETIKGEVTDKDRQFIELVKGIQSFLNVHSGDATAKELKSILTNHESYDTETAVAITKVAL